MSGSHCFCVPPVLACVCFSCACTSRKRTLHQYTDGETQRAACACPAQPASACGPATRRTRARVASAPRSCSNCMHFRLDRDFGRKLVARQLLPAKSNAHAGHCIACMLFRGRRRMSHQLPSKAREIWCERARVFQQTSTTSRSS